MMSSSAAAVGGGDSSSETDSGGSEDNLFSQFCRLCKQLEKEPSYNAKTKVVADFVKHGSSGGKKETNTQ